MHLKNCIYIKKRSNQYCYIIQKILSPSGAHKVDADEAARYLHQGRQEYSQVDVRGQVARTHRQPVVDERAAEPEKFLKLKFDQTNVVLWICGWKRLRGGKN